MDVVAAALGSELNLGATEAAVFGVVSIGEDFYVLNGIFRGRNDCGSPQTALVVLIPSIE